MIAIFAIQFKEGIFISSFLNQRILINVFSKIRGVAQLASVLAWGARGRKFESSHPDKKPKHEVSAFLCRFDIRYDRNHIKIKTELIMIINSFIFYEPPYKNLKYISVVFFYLEMFSSRS